MYLDELVDDESGGLIPATIAHIARDPLDPDFDLAHTVRRIRAKDSEVKRLLLDQAVISGIGNIYADEALWRSGVHGRRQASRLSARQIAAVIDHASQVMAQALAQGGTSFDSLYVNVNGESGYFERSLDAYGREGEPCRRCGAPIRRESFMNRSSFSCPKCQRPPRARGAA
jgi:formamidopyrimidine-DNA glycosylase